MEMLVSWDPAGDHRFMGDATAAGAEASNAVAQKSVKKEQ